MEEKFDLEKTLIEFNQDQQFIELRERYSTRSFLEIMSVERSENRHSSFLAWLLEAKDFAVNVKDHPIIHLMDILIRRMREQKDNYCSDQYEALENLKDSILARDFKEMNIEEVTTEKAVQDVAIDEVDEYKRYIQDRLDIYIKGKLIPSSLSSQDKHFEIIIENKVGTTEGGEKNNNKKNALNESKVWENYCDSKQTVRYYTACHTSERIFVFLTPITNAELDDISKIDENKKCKDKHFVNINYQDILNEIIEPLLANQNLSSRVRVLLEEYVLSLSLPGIYTNEEDDEENKYKKKKDEKSIKTAIIMAERKQDIDTIQKLLGSPNYKNLIISAAKCLVIEDEINKITKKIEKISRKGARNKWIGIKDETIRAALEFEPGNTNVADIYNLILSFGKTYKNLLIALLKTYVENNNHVAEESQTIIDVYQSLLGKPKDRSEFTIIDRASEKVLDAESKRMFAEWIIKKYVEYYNNEYYNNHQNELNDPYKYFNINETYPLSSFSKVKDSTRYSKDPINFDSGQYYISNQWGITINQEKWKKEKKEENLISIDRIFFKIFGEPLFALQDGKTYSTNNNEFKLTLQKPWDEILKDYIITVKRIYK